MEKESEKNRLLYLPQWKKPEEKDHEEKISVKCITFNARGCSLRVGGTRALPHARMEGWRKKRQPQVTFKTDFLRTFHFILEDCQM